MAKPKDIPVTDSNKPPYAKAVILPDEDATPKGIPEINFEKPVRSYKKVAIDVQQHLMKDLNKYGLTIDGVLYPFSAEIRKKTHAEVIYLISNSLKAKKTDNSAMISEENYLRGTSRSISAEDFDTVDDGNVGINDVEFGIFLATAKLHIIEQISLSEAQYQKEKKELEAMQLQLDENEINALSKVLFENTDKNYTDSSIQYWVAKLSGTEINPKEKIEWYQKIAFAPFSLVEGLIGLASQGGLGGLSEFINMIQDQKVRNKFIKAIGRGWFNLSTAERVGIAGEIVYQAIFAAGTISKVAKLLPASSAVQAQTKLHKMGALVRKAGQAFVASPLDDAVYGTTGAIGGLNNNETKKQKAKVTKMNVGM